MPQTASLVELIASIIAAIVSPYLSYILYKKKEEKSKRLEWVDQTASVLRGVRRDVKSIDPKENIADYSPKTETPRSVHSLYSDISDLQKQLDKIPNKYRGTHMENKLSEVSREFHREIESSDPDAVSLRKRILDACSDAFTSIENTIDSRDDLY
jgi:uncharacterized alpha-E superfamily protein